MPIISRAVLRRAIVKKLKECGFKKNGHGYYLAGRIDKERVRSLHAPNRDERLISNKVFLDARAKEMIKHFANGTDVNPKLIDPELIEVHPETEESDLFRFATMLWSVPVSPGFGRRLRFLVRDKQNGKLIGVFALGDPVFNLSARDGVIGWTTKDRAKRLVHILDAFVVGAVPPYSGLIGGKLVAALMCSKEVSRAYESRYLNTKSIISRKRKRARLVLLTTTSALGRSSIYNRLKLPGDLSFMHVGSTKGFGHFHLAGNLFELLRKYLAQRKHPYADGHRFGMGPNWRLRVARTAAEQVGFSGDEILRHGIEREVYLIPLAKNWKEILTGQQKNVRTLTQSADEISAYCKQRWIIPRAEWDQTYRLFQSSMLLPQILNGHQSKNHMAQNSGITKLKIPSPILS